MLGEWYARSIEIRYGAGLVGETGPLVDKQSRHAQSYPEDRAVLRKMLKKRAALTAVMALAAAVEAHHSGALFYDGDDRISIKGRVLQFSFRNPHAIVELEVDSESGGTERWTAETSSPSGLRRRGWSQDSLAIGETVMLEGIRARDGSLLMRITRVVRADGTEVGVPRGIDN